eukprot:CAMPEP_0170313672 /NCGR_PEP_ID=MMETSP0116_2-20130129/57392_1 /TAXON_ID=400756 /ORGANISM="Durinskia baltica, Strain CSIRO CS-38" /LENGTH=83 /DNA_ID=CAMNT_0010566087 /DNA_START=4 /DNA_END=252 /DNA_ORIENTATION=-
MTAEPVACRGTIFKHDSSKSGIPKDADTVRMYFPMFLMTWTTLMGLQQMLPHQFLRESGQLQELGDWMVGKVIFISHEWLGFR